MRVVESEGYRVELDLSDQRLELHSPEPDPSYLRKALSPTPRLDDQFAPAGHFVSASLLAMKAKQFDDGLYAAMEKAAQEGAGRFPGKRALLTELASRGELPPFVYAASTLGGISIETPVSLRADAERAKREFLNDPLCSKPIGFYTWSDSLRAIFQQDRMLQKDCAASAADSLLGILQGTPELLSIYDRAIRLSSRLTNPLAGADLRSRNARTRSFFPASRAYETELITKLYGNRPIPDDFSLAAELLSRIRAGRIDLAPSEDSGWYDYQTWALEPLAVPQRTTEGKRLVFSDSYREQLGDLFKSILSLTRETHVKQLELAVAGCALRSLKPAAPKKKITVRPDLHVEPLLSFYRRRAQGYRFAKGVIEDVFGPGALTAVKRLTPDGPREQNLEEELTEMTSLFDGAADVVAHEIGTREDLSPDAHAFLRWGERMDDLDLSRDARMMVPVYHDVARNKTKVWAVLGWRQNELFSYFRQPPTARVFDAAGRPADDEVDVLFRGAPYPLATPEFAEILVTKVLDRDEFRAHCDRYQTRSKILENLE